MAKPVRRWTRADLEHLPDDGNRYEALDGVLLVTPQASFRHQRVAVRWVMELEQWCRQHQVGQVVGPGAVPVGNSELQPDVQVVSQGSYPDDVKWDQLPLPLLVVEVRSDSTARRDIGIKRRAYQRWRLPEYWVVDPDAWRVLVWTPGSEDPVVVTDTLRWTPPGASKTFELPLGDVM